MVNKKYVVSMISPTIINIIMGAISIQIDSVLAKILSFEKFISVIGVANLDSRLNSYKERKVKIKGAISVMARNGKKQSRRYLKLSFRLSKRYKDIYRKIESLLGVA